VCTRRGEKSIDTPHQFTGEARDDAVEPSEQVSRNGQDFFAFPPGGCADDGAGGAARTDRDQRRGGASGEPGIFGSVLARQFHVQMRASPKQTGHDGRDRNALGAEFGTESLRECNGSKFCAAVGQEVWHCYLAADGGDVHNPPVPAFAHGGKNGLHCVQRAPKHDVHGTLKILGVHFRKRPDLYDSRVVHQNIDWPEDSGHLFSHAADLFRTGDVADANMRPDAPGGEVGASPIKFRLVPRADRDGGTVRAKLSGQGQTQPAGAARDQNYFACKINLRPASEEAHHHVARRCRKGSDDRSFGFHRYRVEQG